MRELGTITRLQIQRSTLKTGEKPSRVYDPAPLLPVERLAVSPDGVLGWMTDGGWIVDVHHRSHPATKNEDGRHGVSVGFTAHYAAMQRRFGERITLGCAGENIIAQSEHVLTLEELHGGLCIVGGEGREVVRLSVLEVASPCRPFTGWALDRTVEPEELKAGLQFLDEGMRGFYCLAEGIGEVSVGDRLIAL